MNAILWILFGALAGWLAAVINNVRISEKMVMIIYGIAGGMTGGWILTIFCNETIGTFNLYSVLSAVLGASLIIWAYKVFTDPRGTSRK